MRLIITRPEPDASRTARALTSLGHEAILSPMLDIIYDRSARLPETAFQAVLATSRNGVRALSEHRDRARLAALPLYAVGDSTALEARRAGFSAARSASGALDDLAALAAAELEPAAGPLLQIAGEHRAGDLGGHLAALGFVVETAILYRADMRKRLSGVAIQALRDGSADGVLLYSRRSAEAFAAALQADGLAPLAPDVACFCLSDAVAAPLAAVSSGPIRIAERPDQISLFAEVERFEASRRTSAPG
jgi:uroporphyrinogen-III synthase